MKNNLQNLIDVHTHTVASRHAYSTVTENIQQAKALGLKYYGVSDHAPATPYTTAPSYFVNLNTIPSDWGSVTLLHGVELDIMDPNGMVDLEDRILDKLDYATASLHTTSIKPTTYEDHTACYINVMKNKHVNILSHPDDGRFPYDVEAVVKAAKENGVLLEINTNSLKPTAYRPNARDWLDKVIQYCLQYDHPVIMGSDAHFWSDVGNHSYCIEYLEEKNFPTDLIVNYHEDLIEKFILTKRK